MELFQNQSGKIKMQLKTKEDKIAAYYIGILPKDELTENEQEIMERWESIWALLNNYHSNAQAIEAHLKKYAGKISRRTAYYDLRGSTKLWGDLVKTTKEAKRVLLDEYSMKCFQMAANNKDVDGMNRAIANMIKLNGLDRSDSELPDPADYEPNTYVLELTLQGDGGKKIINLNETGSIQDTEFEEIINAIDSEEISKMEMRKLLEKAQNGKTEKEDQPE